MPCEDCEDAEGAAAEAEGERDEAQEELKTTVAAVRAALDDARQQLSKLDDALDDIEKALE